MKVFKIIIIFFCLQLFAKADQNNLDQLFQKLKNESDQNLAYRIEDQIWKQWTTHKNDDGLTELMSYGTVLMNNQDYDSAKKIFTKIIKKDPNWAEGWNKRATVYYYQKEYELSQADIDRVIELEERHFGALSGLGLIQIELQNYFLALESYKKAINIYPTMETAKKMIPLIENLIKDKNI